MLPTAEGRHTFLVRNVGNGLFLTAPVSSHGDGAEVHLSDGPVTPRLLWRLVPLQGGRYALESPADNTYLDLWDARDDDEAFPALCDFWNAPQQHWTLRPAPRRRPSRALLTLVRDEPEFFPLWLGYYSRFFDPRDIYVLHHQPPPGLPPDDRFVRIPVYQEVFSSAWQRDLVQHHQHVLVDRYDTVLCTDVDEIVAPDPRYGDLGDYVDRFGESEDYVSCTGYEVLHLEGTEPPFDPSEKVLSQRSTWFSNPLYSKPLLARVPMLWKGGFHERADDAARHDPCLRLIHLHRMDYRICWNRHRRRARQPRDEVDIANERGYQNRIVEPDQFRHWFYNDRVNGEEISPEPIPEHWHRVV
jgi:hypothetical protein